MRKRILDKQQPFSQEGNKKILFFCCRLQNSAVKERHYSSLENKQNNHRSSTNFLESGYVLAGELSASKTIYLYSQDKSKISAG
jgi:hypothetical protein